ncbi:MAG: hypothetical protein HY687_05800 [Chloroflexi bacterium]|nr:hypothetical protein [Chloroflexota bacterium]
MSQVREVLPDGTLRTRRQPELAEQKRQDARAVLKALKSRDPLTWSVQDQHEALAAFLEVIE